MVPNQTDKKAELATKSFIEIETFDFANRQIKLYVTSSQKSQKS